MGKSREELARMGSEELKEILRLDSQGVEEYSTEDILYMLDLIVQREKEAGENHVDVEAAWNRFQRQYLHRGEKTQAPAHTPQVRRWRLPRSLGATAAALALVFVGLLTAGTVGRHHMGGTYDSLKGGLTSLAPGVGNPRIATKETEGYGDLCGRVLSGDGSYQTQVDRNPDGACLTFRGELHSQTGQIVATSGTLVSQPGATSYEVDWTPEAQAEPGTICVGSYGVESGAYYRASVVYTETVAP